MLRGCDEPRSLAYVDALRCATKGTMRAPAHFDEDESTRVTHHEIDLAAPAPVISIDESEAALNEKAFREPLGFAPHRLPVKSPGAGQRRRRLAGEARAARR